MVEDKLTKETVSIKESELSVEKIEALRCFGYEEIGQREEDCELVIEFERNINYLKLIELKNFENEYNKLYETNKPMLNKKLLVLLSIVVLPGLVYAIKFLLTKRKYCEEDLKNRIKASAILIKAENLTKKQ